MERMRRVVLGGAALGVVATGLPGCMFAIGNTATGSEKRLHRLDERITAAEQRLGIAAPAEAVSK